MVERLLLAQSETARLNLASFNCSDRQRSVAVGGLVGLAQLTVTSCFKTRLPPLEHQLYIFSASPQLPSSAPEVQKSSAVLNFADKNVN